MATSVLLYISETKDISTATVVDATTQIATAGSFSFTEDIWNFRTYYVWVQITDKSGVVRTFFLGKAATPRIDLIPPLIGEVMIRRGVAFETSIILQFVTSDTIG